MCYLLLLGKVPDAQRKEGEIYFSLMFSEVSARGSLVPLPSGLWRGRNIMAEGPQGRKLVTFCWQEVEREHQRRRGLDKIQSLRSYPTIRSFQLGPNASVTITSQ